jgi:hypothetical protein
MVHRYQRHPRSLKIHDKEKFFAGVIDTAEQLITGVNDTVINIHSRISPRIFEKIQKGSNGILEGLGDTDSGKKPEVKNLVSDSLLKGFICRQEI